MFREGIRQHYNLEAVTSLCPQRPDVIMNESVQSSPKIGIKRTANAAKKKTNLFFLNNKKHFR